MDWYTFKHTAIRWIASFLPMTTCFTVIASLRSGIQKKQNTNPLQNLSLVACEAIRKNNDHLP